MKQKIIMETSAGGFKHELETAISMGWTVHCVTVNSDTNYWLAVLIK